MVWLVVLISLGLFILYLLIGYYLTRKVITPRVYPSQESRSLEITRHHVDMDAFDRLPKEQVNLASPFGYNLYGLYLPFEGSFRTVIISHGFTHSLYGSVKYIPLFRERGFNVLIFDQRYHGHSGGKNTTFGYFEKRDLRAWVDWVFTRQGPGGVVGTMGESMGAAVTLLEAVDDERLSFVMLDCPFSDLNNLLKYRMSKDIPLLPARLFFPLVKWYCRVLAGMNFDAVSPVREIEKLKTPLFLAHGLEDRYIPPGMSRDLYDMKSQGIKLLYLAPEARHAESIIKNPTEYDRWVGDFLFKAGFSESVLRGSLP